MPPGIPSLDEKNARLQPLELDGTTINGIFPQTLEPCRNRTQITPASDVGSSPAKPYFQLQFGCVLLPVVVNCFWLLPSASISQICSPPARLD
jgi:hypothetical protein